MKRTTATNTKGSSAWTKWQRFMKKRFLLFFFLIPLGIYITSLVLHNLQFDLGSFYVKSYYKNQNDEHLTLQLIQKIASTLQEENISITSSDFIRLLKQHIRFHPQDRYIPYYTFLLGKEYLRQGNNHYAQHYFFDLVGNIDYSLLYRLDSITKQSVLGSLQALSTIETDPFKLINYQQLLIEKFTSELKVPGNSYYFLATHFDEIGEWNKAHASYQSYLQYPALTLSPEAQQRRESIFMRLKRLREENWQRGSVTWNSPEEGRQQVLQALNSHDNRNIVRLRSPGFFTAHWLETLTDPNTHVPNFDISAVLARSNLSVAKDFSPISTETLKFWKTQGWGRVPTWYFVFSKISLPNRPDINGRWEWAGIYFGIGNSKYVPNI